MITNKQKNQINEVWNALEYNLSCIDWTNYGKRLLELTTEESKRHDNFRGNSISRGMSLKCEAKYFAIKRVIEYINGENAPQADEYFFIQRSCFAAYAIATNKRFQEARTKWLDNFATFANEIASWDYCNLITEKEAA